MQHLTGSLCAKDTEVQELFLDADTVRRRYNIEPYIDNEGNEGWRFDEDILTYEEYFKEIVPVNQEITEESLGELSALFALYQEQVDTTFAELSILIGGNS